MKMKGQFPSGWTISSISDFTFEVIGSSFVFYLDDEEQEEAEYLATPSLSRKRKFFVTICVRFARDAASCSRESRTNKLCVTVTC